MLQGEALLLYGDGCISDELCGLKIDFTYNSFYQIHSEQCEVLYSLAKKMLDLKPTDTLLDTYCGVGTIGLSMADACKKVMGVEVNPDAIECAKRNAKQNKIRNAQFVAMDSTEFMTQARKFHNHFDAIILDSPRAGTTKQFIEAACSLSPKKILYISQIKRKCGIEVGENYNLPKTENPKVPQCPKEKEDAIKAALKYFAMI